MGQPFKMWAVVGRGESHRSHSASHWMFQRRKLTSVRRVSEEALKTKDSWPGWRPDNNQFQVPQAVSSLAESSNFDCTVSV